MVRILSKPELIRPPPTSFEKLSIPVMTNKVIAPLSIKLF